MDAGVGNYLRSALCPFSISAFQFLAFVYDSAALQDLWKCSKQREPAGDLEWRFSRFEETPLKRC
jgi:hypothetical protein